MRAAAWGFVAVAMGPVAACASDSTFACAGNVECSSADAAGVCITGFCAFPDPACDSGQRFGKYSPARIAGRCVPPEDADEGEVETGAFETKGGETFDPSDAGSSSGEDTSLPPYDSDASTDPLGESSSGEAESCATLFVEEFVAAELDLVWTEAASYDIDVDPPPDPATFAIVDDALVIAISDDQLTAGWVQRSDPMLEPPFSIVASIDPPQESSGYAFLELSSITPHRIEVGPADLRLVADDETLLVEPYDAVAHAWLRITARTDAVAYETSPDGTTWTELLAVPPFEPQPTYYVSVGMRVAGTITSTPVATVERVSACAWTP